MGYFFDQNGGQRERERVRRKKGLWEYHWYMYAPGQEEDLGARAGWDPFSSEPFSAPYSKSFDHEGGASPRVA
jgi:hypothetical protein